MPDPIRPEEHLGLVGSVARTYLGRSRAFDFDDLCAYGVIGLIRAIELFDPARDVKFSTYASYWIKHAIRSALITKAPAIPVPAYLTHKGKAGERNRDRFARSIALARSGVGNLGAPGDDGRTIEPPTDRPGPLESAMAAEDLGRLASLLEDLAEAHPREAEVIRCRFGVGGREKMTLEAIAGRFGLTKERVRQIESEALARLRDWALVA